MIWNILKLIWPVLFVGGYGLMILSVYKIKEAVYKYKAEEGQDEHT